MNPKIKIIPTFFVLTYLSGYLCQDQQYSACSQPFTCGSIRDISYPFWGGIRPSYCGYPGFRLDCQGDMPILNISSMLYNVLDINNITQTLQVARQDLWNGTCPGLLRNTTLDFHLFDYSSASGDQIVTLYYGCTSNQEQIENIIFNCSQNVTEGFSFYVTEETGNSGFNFTCADNIFVPVNRPAAQQLENPGISLRDAIRSGFSVQWSANDMSCRNCLETGGVCGFDDQVRDNFACYCEDRPHAVSCINTRTQNGSDGGLSELQKIVTLVCVLGISCIIIPCMILICHCSNKCISCDPDEQSNQYVEKFMREQGSLAPKRYKYKELKKITKGFTDKLGQGGFGSVYKGILPDGRPVAVKVLKETEGNGEEFINEVSSISRTSHVNIVNLLGFCYTKSKRALVYEFMPNKSLDRFINQDELVGMGNQLGWKKLYEIAIGVARGLEYLHRGCNARIIHFDIKPQNILLDEEFCPKISDFGLAKLCRKKQSILTSVFGTRGTFGYIAPEVFCRNFGPVSHKSDVYSYGMMVLEMAGARKIEEASSFESSEKYFPDKIYEQEVVYRMETVNENMCQEEVETMRKMFLIAFWCIQTVPSNRPSMSKVVEMFEGSVESIQIPPKPLLSSPVLSQSQSQTTQSECSSSFTVLDLETESITEV